MATKSKDLIINNPQLGLADSPHLGYAEMRNLDVSSVPGIAKLNLQMQKITSSPYTSTFTADASTDTITLTTGTLQFGGHGANYRAVTVSNSGGALPGGLSAGTTYFVIDVSQSTIKLATSAANAVAGTAIDITSAGTGTQTITSVDPTQIKQYALVPGTDYVYLQDTSGRVWFKNGSSAPVLVSGNTLTNPNANGLGVWKNYVFAFRDYKVDVCAVGSYSPSWSNDWQTLIAASTTQAHPVFVGQDDILYFADKNQTTNAIYVGSISEASGQTFAPGTAASYTFNNQALRLPNDQDITCFAELGKNLLVGTIDRYIYPWDRTSATFNLPIVAAERNITAMVVLNNVLYYACGNRGSLYAYNGYASQLVTRIPPYLSNYSATISSLSIHKGRIFMTVKTKGNSGVWSFNPSTGALVFEYQNSAQSTETTNALNVPLVFSDKDDVLHFSWYDQDASTYGLDSPNPPSASAVCPTGYIGYFYSALIDVGNAKLKRTFTECELMLTKPLASGQGVQVSYRTNLTNSWTTLATFDYTTYGAEDSFNKVVNATNCDSIQIKCALTAPGTTSATPEVKSVTLR